MGDSHLQCLLGSCSCSQSESWVWTFVGLRLTSCNRMIILWPVKCWHTLFSFIPAVGPSRKSVHLPHSSMAKLFLGVTWGFLGFFLCLHFIDFIAFRNLSAAFGWSSSMSTCYLTWGWGVKGRASGCFLQMPLSCRDLCMEPWGFQRRAESEVEKMQALIVFLKWNTSF